MSLSSAAPGPVSRSGLSPVPHLRWGAHVCQLYRTAQDLVDVLVPYFAAGLHSNEQCLWITSAPLGRDEARAALAREVTDLDARLRAGQIEILDHEAWYLRAGRLGTRAVLRGWIEREQAALARGYAGLRINGNTSWLSREDWTSFSEYEAQASKVFQGRQILALCSYSLECCTSDDVVDVLHTHELALARRGCSWELVQSATGVLATIDELPAVPIGRPDTGSSDTGPILTGPIALEAGDGRAAPAHDAELDDRVQLAAELRRVSIALERETRRRRRAEADRSRLARAETLARTTAASAREHLLRLQDVTSALSEAASVAEIARVVVTDMAAVLGAAQAILAVPCPDRDALILLDHAGLRESAIENFRTFPIEGPLPVALAFRTGSPVWLPSREALCAHYPEVSDSTTRAVACMPLSIGERRLGAIGFGFAEERAFTASDRALVHDLGRQVALALDRARLYDEARRARDRLQLLVDAASRIAVGGLDLAQVLQSIVDAVTGGIAECCAITLRGEDGKTLDLGALRHVDPRIEAELRETIANTPVEVTRSLTGGVVETGTAVLLPTVPADAFTSTRPEHRAHHERNPVQSLLIVPLRVAGETIGALAAARYRPLAPFQQEDQDLLQELADRAALAIESARLHARVRDASRRKDEFLAVLGHELRNPLAPIATALQLMTLRGDTQSVKERAVIERQVEHVRRLVDDLLDVSRITRGQLELRTERVDLGAVVTRAVEMTSPLIEQREHRLHLEASPEPVLIEVDPMRFAQVLANLLTNAARYSEPGGRIDVSWRQQGDAVSIRVRDTGIGIPPDQLTTIFESFVQAQRSVQRAQGGLGLGLALVKSLVELHGGEVGARSEGLGRGSEFTVTIPAMARSEQALGRAAGVAGETRLAPDRARRVLVVDDNPDAAEVLADLLRMVGHEVDVAYDGPQALARAPALEAEVAILDIGLPVMDGYELARRLREEGGAPLRLIAVTGYGTDADRERSREAGFDAHLTKPVDLAAVLASITADEPS